MYFRQLLNDETACASYLFGCKSKATFAVVDPHVDLVDEYVKHAAAQGARIDAVIETHVQADHVSMSVGVVVVRCSSSTSRRPLAAIVRAT